MMGFHPDEKRQLTELEERAADYATLLAPTAVITTTDAFGRALALWRDSWPGCSPVAAAYLFRPTGPRSPEERQIAEQDYQKTFEKLKRRAQASSMARDRAIWTTSLHPSNSLRQVFEDLSGLSSDAKSRFGLDSQDPGFLRRYVTAHAAPIEDLVTPRQFEELVADIYRTEGWHCSVTRYSKDNGVDIEATRKVNDVELVVLIQVKRNRSRGSAGGRPRPVGLDDVKTFAATVRAEGRDTGVLVTSSYFTRDGVRWAQNKGLNVAHVEFVNGENVRARLCEIARHGKAGDIASYILNARR
jgi:HJR/Mrr/RecB family endonuclease